MKVNALTLGAYYVENGDGIVASLYEEYRSASKAGSRIAHEGHGRAMFVLPRKREKVVSDPPDPSFQSAPYDPSRQRCLTEELIGLFEL